MSRAVEQLKDEGSKRQVVAAGAIAGLVSRFAIAPLDVVKIRLQLQIHSLSDPLSQIGVTGPIYKGTLGTLRHILREEGLTALWKGNIPAEALYVAYGAIQFGVYRSTNNALQNVPHPYTPPDKLATFVSGALAGTIATTTTYPMDVLRTRFAAQGRDKIYRSISESVRSIALHEGLPGFFRGIGAGVAQIVPYMGLFFVSYETLKPSFATVLPLPLHTSDAAAGIAASIISKTAVYPLDTVRKRLQVQGPTLGYYIHRNIPAYHGGVLSTIKDILVNEGPRGMYRGLSVSLLKAAPASAVTMWTYERVMQFMVTLEQIGEDY